MLQNLNNNLCQCTVGKGLFTTKFFEKGSFLMEYRGAVSQSDGNDRDDTDFDFCVSLFPQWCGVQVSII